MAVKGRKYTAFDIHWYVDGKVKERIQMRADYGLCKWKISKLKEENAVYRVGKMIIVGVA